MGRIDSPCLTHDPLAATATAGLGALDAPASAVDGTDAPAVSWESAWIDLGGEG